MNVVIYARFSSHSQTEQSIEGQLNTCYEYARNHGFTVIHEYIDRAQSGTSDNRSSFQRMINDSVHHAFQGVLVYQLDRFARNRYDSAIYKARLKKNGVRVMSAKENIADDASGILVEGVLESMAEYYSVELSQKIHRGMEINAKKCLSNGSNPGLGFKVDKDRRFYVDEKEAAIVREVFERYSYGETATSIIEDLNDRNIQTSRGNPFNKNSLHRMFRNKRYIGTYIYKNTEIAGGMPRIIDDELFYRVQDVLARNKVAPGRTRGKKEYLLTTKLFCGHCGEMMTGYTGTGKSGMQYHYYICNGRKEKRCNKKLVPKKAIEESVIKICLSLLTEERIDQITDRLLIASQRKDEVISIKRIKAAIEDADRAIENLWIALEHGQSVEMITKRIDQRNKEKADLEEQLAKEELKFEGFDYTQIKAYLQHIKKLPGNELEKKRALISIFVNRIYLYDDHYTLILNGGNRALELENIPIGVINSPGFPGETNTFYSSSLDTPAPPELLESKLSWARVSFCPSCSDRFASSTFICNFTAILP